jgi:integrase/recombinase XerC
LRGSSQPAPYGHAAPIHGLKGDSLQHSGLYDAVKAICAATAERLVKTDHAGAARLRSASPHGLRHAYACTLVVDRAVSLPAAQASLRTIQTYV